VKKEIYFYIQLYGFAITMRHIALRSLHFTLLLSILLYAYIYAHCTALHSAPFDFWWYLRQTLVNCQNSFNDM